MIRNDSSGLQRMYRLMERLGHPEREFKICHVAGSKGKGSTARMLAEILAAETGRAVGVYASPHVTDPRERIGSTEGFFDDAVYERAQARVEAAAEGALGRLERMGWFERMTAVAFCCFAEMGLEWVVVETGIGGRLDSTNVIERPEICLITAMELTHCAKLGYTIEEIAREKGGIIKPGVPVVLAKQRYAEAVEVIEGIARTVGSEGAVGVAGTVGVAGAVGVVGAPLYRSDDLPEGYRVRMRGRVQRENAATASTAARLLGASETAIAAGLEKAWLPGRFEMRPLGDALLVLDGAHTVESWRALMETFGGLGDGDGSAELVASKELVKSAELMESADSAGGDDSADLPARMAERPRYLLAKFKGNENETRAMREIVAGERFDRIWEVGTDAAKRKAIIAEALETARRDGALLLVAGSFYLLGDVEEVLRGTGASASI